MIREKSIDLEKDVQKLTEKNLKTIFLDVGLCSRALGLTFNELKQEKELILINSGGIAEQIVGQNLRTILPPYVEPLLYYWHREEKGSNAEVDYVIDQSHEYTPIEVKWTDKPTISDAKHIKKFIEEYSVKKSYIICRTPHRYKITENITALPWQEIGSIFGMKI